MAEGRTLTDNALRRLGSVVRHVEGQSRGGHQEGTPAPINGGSIIFGKITAQGTGDNIKAYSWIQVKPIQGGAFEELPSDLAMSGDATSTPLRNPAYEMNGDEEVEDDTYAIFWPGAQTETGGSWVQEWVFARLGGAGAGTVVRVTSTTLSGNYYPGRLQRFNATSDAWEDISGSDDIWVKEANGWVPRADRHNAVLASNSDGSPARPVYTVAEGGRVVRGKLDGTLNQGSSATLSIWKWNGSAEADTGDNITVYAWLMASGQSVASGKEVTAHWDSLSGRWYVLGAECA